MGDWPEPVDFVPEPKKGIVQVNVTIDEMKAEKKFKVTGDYVDSKVSCVWKKKSPWILWLEITCTRPDGSSKVYDYRHKVRKEMDPEKTTYKIISPKKIGIRIAKKNVLDDWSQEADYLTTNQAELTPIPDDN